MSLQTYKESLGMIIISESKVLNDPKLFSFLLLWWRECGWEKGWRRSKERKDMKHSAFSRSQECVGLPSEMQEGSPK